VFGQIKASAGIPAVSLRGFEKAKAEWALVCATHNLLKMYRVCLRIRMKVKSVANHEKGGNLRQSGRAQSIHACLPRSWLPRCSTHAPTPF